MKLLARLFGLSSAAPKQSDFQQSQLILPESPAGKQAANAARTGTRRELLRVVLQDTLTRQGIPASWLGGETLISTSRSGTQGLHWRLLVRHWDPRLLTHAMALQQKLHFRVMTLDPLAANWLTGISWQFALNDESQCPGLPHPGTWTAQPPSVSPAAQPAPASPAVGVIAGPVRISDPHRSRQEEEAAVRDDLERLLAARQAEFKHNQARSAPLPRAAFLRTEPMPLE